MAFLLLLHQKMSLQRKVNKLTLAQTSIGTRKERITKRIEKVQQAYAKKQSRLDAQAKLMTSKTNNEVSNYMLRMQSQFQNISAHTLLLTKDSGYYQKEYADLFAAVQKAAEKNGVGSKAHTEAQEKLTQFQNSDKFKQTAQNAQTAAMEYNNNLAIQRQMQQQMINSYSTSINDQVSIWLEAEKQKLEDEEQMALAPLEAEDTQIDLEQASNEAQLSYAQSRLDAIKQALDSQAQEAPKFGA